MDFNRYGPTQQQQVTLDIMRFGAQQRIPAALLQTLRMETTKDRITQDLLVQIQGTILSKEARSETMPDEITHEVTQTLDYVAFASWWDHAKFSFRTRFPKLGRRLTVKTRLVKTTHLYQTIQRVTNVYHVCPHLEHDPSHVHMRFMTRSNETDDVTRLATIEARIMERYPAIGHEYMVALSGHGLLNIVGDTQERREFLREFLSTRSNLAPGLLSLLELL